MGALSYVAGSGERRTAVKKSRVPPGDYITFKQFNEILDLEKWERYRVLFHVLWFNLPRIEEALAIRPIDIDMLTGEAAGYPNADHTLRIYRTKTQEFDFLPLDSGVHDLLKHYIMAYKIPKQERLFKMTRIAVLEHCYHITNKHSIATVGGIKRLHPHAFRRGGGIWMLSSGWIQLNDLCALYGHVKQDGSPNLSMTLRYLGQDKRGAFDNIARFYKSRNAIVENSARRGLDA